MPEGLALFSGLAASSLAYVLLQRAALRLSPLVGKGLSDAGRRSVAGAGVAAIAGAQIYAFFLLASARPLAALTLSCGFGALLLCLNLVKEKLLREPLTLVDVYLLPQVFRYPELYFPYLPVKALALGLGVGACALAVLCFLEPPAACMRKAGGAFSALALILSPAAASLLMNKGRLPRLNRLLLSLCSVSHDAARDARVNGPLAAALMHPLLAGKLRREGKDFLRNPDKRPLASHWPESIEQALFGAAAEAGPQLPHIVLLQAESFYDVRPLLPAPAREQLHGFLPNWEALEREGATLPTPPDAFGAYTMRTEFQVLTGLAAPALGPWAFNPYVFAAGRPMWSLARWFKGRGYGALCIHPYYRHFFSRHKVMPNLGFDAYDSLETLPPLARFGPHTSDLALGDELLKKLEDAPKPLFCFVITMEAHGPWLPGRLSADQIERTLEDLDRSVFDPRLQMYLCHLRRMDMLLGKIRRWSAGRKRDERKCLLLAYGDHAPALDFAAKV